MKTILKTNFAKNAAIHSLILILSFLVFGIIEFYNNILFKLFETNILPNNLLVSFFPILAMYLLKSMEFIVIFLLIFAVVTLAGKRFTAIFSNKSNEKYQANEATEFPAIIGDLLIPALLIYLIFFKYESSPFTLTYYFYYLSHHFSPLLQNMMAFKTLTLIANSILALVIAVVFIKFRPSAHQRNYIPSLLFIIVLAIIPGLLFLIHYFDHVLITAALLSAILLLLTFLTGLLIQLFKSRHRLFGAFLIVLMLMFVFVNLHFFKSTKNTRLNVVHIILDTLRMQSFNDRTMPFLYSFKNKGVWFPNSYSSSDNTVTSHNAIYYGKYPSIIGLEKGPYPSTTLMEALRSNNYHTAVISANGRFCIVNGFDKGVDDFYEAWRTENHIRNIQIMDDYHLSAKFPIIINYLNQYEKMFLNRSVPINKNGLRSNEYRYYNYEPAAVVNEFVKGVIRKNPRSQPFYLFVNYLDPHAPYLSPDPQKIGHVIQELKTSLPAVHQKMGFDHLSVSDTTIYHQIMLMWNEVDSLQDKTVKDKFLTFCYEENLKYLDDQMRELFDYFDQIQLGQNTLVIVTSDHGESIGEHNLYEHGNKRLYNQEIQVPLFFLFPEKFGALTQNKIVRRNAQSIDFFPTIIDFLGIKTDLQLNGESLLPYIFTADTGNDAGYSISEYTGVSAITDHAFKLIITDKTTELYDLLIDPKEENNLAEAMPIKVTELKKALRDLKNTAQAVAPQSTESTLPQHEYDAETIKQLKTLGYIK